MGGSSSSRGLLRRTRCCGLSRVWGARARASSEALGLVCRWEPALCVVKRPPCEASNVRCSQQGRFKSEELRIGRLNYKVRRQLTSLLEAWLGSEGRGSKPLNM